MSVDKRAAVLGPSMKARPPCEPSKAVVPIEMTSSAPAPVTCSSGGPGERDSQYSRPVRAAAQRREEPTAAKRTPNRLALRDHASTP